MSDACQPSALTDREYLSALQYIARRARDDFRVFCLLFYPPGHSSYIFSACHEFLMERVQGVVDGTHGKRQAISMPPQHGKSTLLSDLAPSWLLGKVPGVSVAITGFSHELVTDFSKAIKARVQDPLYQLVFPGVRISGRVNREDYWGLTNGSVLRAKSTGKKLTGRRIDWLIIDDAHAGREEAESETARKSVAQWYFGDCVSRLAPGATIFMIGTRWHRQDLIGKLTGKAYVDKQILEGAEDEVFDVVNMPAVWEQETPDELGRAKGDALFPEVRNADFLRKRKAIIPLFEWRSAYQGDPRTQASGQVDIDLVRYIPLAEVPARLERCRAWDLAVADSTAADYTSGAKGCMDPETGNFYVVDVARNQKPWTKNQGIITGIADRERIRMRMETVAGFLACYQVVRQALLGKCRVERSNPVGNKLARANRWFPTIEAGKFFVVRADWNDAFIAELASFPDGDNDDQVDSVSILWDMFARDRMLHRKRQEAMADSAMTAVKHNRRPTVGPRPGGRTASS